MARKPIIRGKDNLLKAKETLIYKNCDDEFLPWSIQLVFPNKDYKAEVFVGGGGGGFLFVCFKIKDQKKKKKKKRGKGLVELWHA